MIIQPYAFKGDFDDVYAKARQFCARLFDAGLSVSLPDGFRSNTKSYPDHELSSVTVIEVFPDIAVAEQFEIAEKIFEDVMAKPAMEEDAYITTARDIVRCLQVLVLENIDNEGWRLIDTSSDLGVVFWGIGNTRAVLEATHKYACTITGKDPEKTIPALLVTGSSNDDFDQFLDADDLP